MSVKKGLGKGLGAVFGDEAVKKAAEKTATNSEPTQTLVKISYINTNKNQPRKRFDEAKLEELTESIKAHGIITPLIVEKKSATSYEIIAGERRFRAAQAAGLSEVPVCIKEYTPREKAEVAIIENLQRDDLNPIEEAAAYKSLIDEYGLTQEEVATSVSKDRSTITNMLRLLKLDEYCTEMLQRGLISMGHARALLSVTDANTRKQVADKLMAESMSVRELEKYIATLGKKPAKKPAKKTSDDMSIYYEEYESRFRDKLGTQVHIRRKDKNKGRIEIEYYSAEELDRILEMVVG